MKSAGYEHQNHRVRVFRQSRSQSSLGSVSGMGNSQETSPWVIRLFQKPDLIWKLFSGASEDCFRPDRISPL